MRGGEVWRHSATGRCAVTPGAKVSCCTWGRRARDLLFLLLRRRRLRAARGLSQEALAHECGINRISQRDRALRAEYFGAKGPAVAAVEGRFDSTRKNL
jgi:hypothetical protein